MGQSYSNRSGGCCSLQGCLDQWSPDDRGGCGCGSSSSSSGSLDIVSTVCHLSVVLHNLLDDLILLVVENTRIEVMLDFMQQNGIFLACRESEERKSHSDMSKYGRLPQSFLPDFPRIVGTVSPPLSLWDLCTVSVLQQQDDKHHIFCFWDMNNKPQDSIKMCLRGHIFLVRKESHF